MSIRPNASRTRSTAARMCSGSATLPASPIPPSCSAARRTSSGSLAVTHTRAPASASCRATAAPMPRVAPVTRATLPCSPGVIAVPSHDGPSVDSPETGVACRDQLQEGAPVLQDARVEDDGPALLVRLPQARQVVVGGRAVVADQVGDALTEQGAYRRRRAFGPGAAVGGGQQLPDVPHQPRHLEFLVGGGAPAARPCGPPRLRGAAGEAP